MTCSRWFATSRRTHEAGQAMAFLVLALGLVLLGAVAFSVDMGNMWFHRQSAQVAADAACTAGAMDLLRDAQGEATGHQGFTAGTPFNCSGVNASASPCQYAALNGYSGTNGNDVAVSFPTSNANVPTGKDAEAAGLAPNAFMKVTVTDNVQTYFAGMLSGSSTQSVGATAECGVVLANAPIPIIVLNPSCSHAFQLDGNTNVKIVGGPPRSIQVDSDNTTCAAATTNAANGCSSSGPTIDLSQGGPNFTGSDFGVTGAPSSPPSGFTGHSWGPASPINDPYAKLAAPAAPSTSPTASIDQTKTNVAYNVHGCPDAAGCIEYQPGLYTKSIIVKNITAIFDPGIYYIQPTTPDTENSGTPGSGCVSKPTGQSRYGLAVDSNGVVRPADPSNNAIGNTTDKGTIFYLTGTASGNYASVFFGSNAGKAGSRTIDQFQTINATCDGVAPDAKLNLASSVSGNVLLGQCTSDGSYIATGGTNTGNIRGILFFQDRANADTNGQASMQGGGGLVLSGNMYFHNCASTDSASAGTNCQSPTTGFNAFFQLQGVSGGNAYVLGNITTDELILGGGGNIAMLLNKNAVYRTLRATLLR